MFRPLVAHAQLHQQSGGGGMEVKAALEHGRLCGGSFGRQVDDHETLKLLQELLRHGVARALGLLPRHLEPVEGLIHLHHLLVKSASRGGSAQVWGRKQKHSKTARVNAGIWHHVLCNTTFFFFSFFLSFKSGRLRERTCGSRDAA